MTGDEECDLVLVRPKVGAEVVTKVLSVTNC